jgi:hypothetical protein
MSLLPLRVRSCVFLVFAVAQATVARSFAGNYHTTDTQPNSIDGKFVSDRTDKVRKGERGETRKNYK